MWLVVIFWLKYLCQIELNDASENPEEQAYISSRYECRINLVRGAVDKAKASRKKMHFYGY